MKGQYIPFNDGYGIVGYGYKCPKCKHVTEFTDCEEGCEKCGFSEIHVDPNDWYEGEMSKPKNERAWNRQQQEGIMPELSERIKLVFTNGKGGIIWYLFIIPLWFAICLNLGKAAAYLIWSLVIWIGILPYLEKIFGWFVLF